VESDVADRRLARWQFYFDNQPNMLDQFLVNKNMATGNALTKVVSRRADLQAASLVNPGVYPKPIPFGGMGIRSIRTDSPTTFQSRSESPRSTRPAR
jgi:hypothetical protein